MKLNTVETTVERGQLWQLDGSQVQIVFVGRSLVHFKHLRHAKQKGIGVQLQKISELQDTLRLRGAKLVCLPKSPPLAA